MRLLKSGIGAAVVGVVWLSLFASTAPAAFPGANGLLAVQPQFGDGMVLVSTSGKGARRICLNRERCGTAGRPRWSPDGRALVFAGPGIGIVYADGSCLNCSFAGTQFDNQPSDESNPAFKPAGNAVSFVDVYGELVLDGTDGLPEASPGVGTATDAVWSAGGELAVVRGNAIWAGRPRHLMRMVAGADPSWAPRGDAIAAVRGGWVVLVGVGNRRVRRLVRGSAPAFSPDGRWIAFVSPGHRLAVIPVRSRHAHPRLVGNVRAVSVDWQPVPRGPNPGCVPPPGSKALASSPQAVLTSAQRSVPSVGGVETAYMGCLRANGRERSLASGLDGGYYAMGASNASVAAPYAAWVWRDDDWKYQQHTAIVQVFDLRTGEQQTRLGGEHASGCPNAGCEEIDQLVLGSDGVSAARTHLVAPVGYGSTPLLDVDCAPASTLCLATDMGGPPRLFTSSDPASGAPSWNSGTFSFSSRGALACPSTSFCVAASNRILASTSPSGGASTWTVISSPGGVADGASCPSTSLCVVSQTDGSVATSTNPAAGPSAWSSALIDPNRALDAVICSAKPQCFVSDSSQAVLTSTNPSGGSGAWTGSATTPPFWSGSCPTPNLCVTVNGPTLATTTDPGSGAWKQHSIPVALNGINCPSASLCVAVGYAGALAISTDPASGDWSYTTIDNARELSSISCPSVSLCVAVDRTGHVVTSTNPTGGPDAWTPALIDGDPCTDTTQCSIEHIQASDATGLHTLDSSEFRGTGPFLTQLALTSDTLSWSHNGTPRSSSLSRP